MTITINNLTINVTGVASEERPSPFSALLATVLTATPRDERHEAQAAQADTQPTPEYPDLVKDALVAFLQPCSKFTFRTLSAIIKAFPAYQSVEIKEALDQLVQKGAVTTRRRRADGETLYVANVESYVSAACDQEVAEPDDNRTLTNTGVIEFLRSDERYKWRSEAAIQRHFNGTDANSVAATLRAMFSWGRINSHINRDGTLMYSAVI